MTTRPTRRPDARSAGRSRRSTSRTRSATATPKPLRRCGPARPGCGRCSRSCRWPSARGWRTRTRSDTRYRQAANEFADPYQVPDANFGWSARDACYAYGSFVLDDDEALVITHRPPTCRFWNLVVWNQFMATPGVADARSSVNGHTAVPNADGSVTVVLSPRDDRAPQFAYHAGLSARQPRVPVVPRRRGARAARGSVGEGGRRADARAVTRRYAERQRQRHRDRPHQHRQPGVAQHRNQFPAPQPVRTGRPPAPPAARRPIPPRTTASPASTPGSARTATASSA